MALLARGAVGDVADRVDRLVGGAGGDDDLAPRQRLRRGVEQGFYRRDDLQRLGHAALAGLAALGHLAAVGADEMDAVLFKRRAVAARRLVAPHFRVHGRGHQHRLVGRQQHRRGEIIGQAVGKLRHQIGGGGRYDQQVGLARQADMADIMLVLPVEQLGEDMVGGQRADRKRRDELLRRRRHDAAHRSAALAQAADQVERLVGRDAAADDEENALAGKGHAMPVAVSGRLQRRLNIRMDEIVALEQQREVPGLGQGVGKAVAEIEFRRMSGPCCILPTPLWQLQSCWPNGTDLE